MVKLFSAHSLKELEKQVNDFEREFTGVVSLEQHSIAYGDGIFLMSVVLVPKIYH